MTLDLNQEKCCYILGFFWADCYFGISSRGIYNFSLEIKTDDFLNIWSYIQNIGFEKYKTRKRKNSNNLQSFVRSARQKEMQFFKKYNFDKKNNGCPLYFDLKDKMKPFFIKGFLDGDGSISLDKNNAFRIGFNGSKHQNWDFLEDFCNKNNIKFAIYRKDRIAKHKTHKKQIHGYSVFEFTNIENRLKMCNILDLNIGLSRKIEIYKKYKKNRDEANIQKNILKEKRLNYKLETVSKGIKKDFNQKFVTYSKFKIDKKYKYIGTFKTLDEALEAQKNVI
jgi:hypothetical protein